MLKFSCRPLWILTNGSPEGCAMLLIASVKTLSRTLSEAKGPAKRLVTSCCLFGSGINHAHLPLGNYFQPFMCAFFIQLVAILAYCSVIMCFQYNICLQWGAASAMPVVWENVSGHTPHSAVTAAALVVVQALARQIAGWVDKAQLQLIFCIKTKIMDEHYLERFDIFINL